MMRFRHATWLSFALVGGLALVGTAPLAAQRPDPDRRAEQVDRQTRTLAIGSSGTLTLRNISGPITVTAGGSREATIEIVRTSRGRTDADARLGLERVQVAVDVRGDRASVRAEYPRERRPAYSVSVAYHVATPAGTTVDVSNVSGETTITGITGEVSVDVVSGPVTLSKSRATRVNIVSGSARLTDCSTAGRLTLTAISGDVVLDRVSARHAALSVTSGTLSATDLAADTATLGALSGDIYFTGALARTGRYELQTHSGDIHVTTSSGFDLEAQTFSGAVRPDRSVTLQTTSSSRTSTRGTVGGGGAQVVATTFSGDVILSAGSRR
jgi:DUF4097 and DUF4098 domain-containing protein YvlB